MKADNPQGRFCHEEAQRNLVAARVFQAAIAARKFNHCGHRPFRAFSWVKNSVILVCLSLSAATQVHAQRIEISWPTPNPAWERGRDFESWVQPTVSGEARSGLWGSVRSNGTQFHEGLDIKPVGRDAR